MVVLTQEKRNLLEKLSRDGVISALAFDQRGALKRMMANYQTLSCKAIWGRWDTTGKSFS